MKEKQANEGHTQTIKHKGRDKLEYEKKVSAAGLLTFF